MTNRTRIKYYPESAGFRVRSGTRVDFSDSTGHEMCQDFVHQGDCLDLNIEKLIITGGVLNGAISSQTYCQNYRVLRYRDGQFPESLKTSLAIAGRPSDGQLAFDLVKRTNPSRPEVDLPVSVVELRDIPRLLKTYGDNLRNVPNTILKYQFGIAPLVSDLRKVMSFHDYVNRRYAEINALYAKGLRRTVDLWSGSTPEYRSASGRYVESLFTTIVCDEYRSGSTTVRGHIRWVPTRKVPNISNAAKRLQALKAISGLTVDFSTAWNLIPWSWMIDWIAPIGDSLEAYRNTVGARPAKIVLMEETHSKFRSQRTSSLNSAYKFTELNGSFIRKRRYLATPSPEIASFPELSSRRLSILSSLAALRLQRGGLKLS